MESCVAFSKDFSGYIASVEDEIRRPCYPLGRIILDRSLSAIQSNVAIFETHGLAF